MNIPGVSRVPLLLAIGLVGCAPSPGPAPSVESGDPKAPTVATGSADPAPEHRMEIPESLKARIEAAIDHVRYRELFTNNAFWTVFHGALAFGPGLTLTIPQTGERVAAFDCMLGGQPEQSGIRGLRFIPTAHGLDVGMGPTFVGQGHQDQFVAILAQWNIPGDRIVIADDGGQYIVMDFVREIQAHAKLGMELSWAIIALGHYLGTDIRWTNRDGEVLTYEDLVRSEMDNTIHHAACGGTHRLIGLTWAYHLHHRSGGDDTGIWIELGEMIRKYQLLARKFQNPDGSFSTNYLLEPGSNPEMQERINSTGHVFEWLSLSLGPQELGEQWVQDAAGALSLMFLDIQSLPMESGALYHATKGLVVYYNRLFGWEYFADQQPRIVEHP